MLCIDEQRQRSRSRVRSLAVDRSWPQSAYMPHATGSIECLYYVIVSATVETYLR